MKPLEIKHALERPFPENKVKWRKAFGKNQQGKMLAYVNARDVQQRLDDVLGINNWQTRFPFPGCCELSIRIDGEWITKSDCADETNIEAAKGQASDSFKRAASAHGIARYLYSITGNELPEWATPEGYDELLKLRNQ
jgi:hypothetical protein